MRFSLSALVAIVVAQMASATYVAPKPQSCPPNEFLYNVDDGRAVCIPKGGFPSRPGPPSGVQCPTDWTYEGKNKCCLPKNPKPPVPQCPKNWIWWALLHKCLPTPQPPTPHPPQPSKPAHGGHKRRNLKSRTALCPLGLNACPIRGLEAGDYECVDITSDLASCGGCATQGKGQDCNTIEGAWVGCARGSCTVTSCFEGYQLRPDGKSCSRLSAVSGF